MREKNSSAQWHNRLEYNSKKGAAPMSIQDKYVKRTQFMFHVKQEDKEFLATLKRMRENYNNESYSYDENTAEISAQHEPYMQSPASDSLCEELEHYSQGLRSLIAPRVETIRCDVCGEIREKAYTVKYDRMAVEICSLPCKRTWQTIIKNIICTVVKKTRQNKEHRERKLDVSFADSSLELVNDDD